MLRHHLHAFAPRPAEWPVVLDTTVRGWPSELPQAVVILGYWGDCLAGLGFARTLCKHFQLESIPVLLLSNDAGVADLCRAQSFVSEVRFTLLTRTQLLRAMGQVSTMLDGGSRAWLQPYCGDWDPARLAVGSIHFKGRRVWEAELAQCSDLRLPEATHIAAERLWWEALG